MLNKLKLLLFLIILTVTYISCEKKTWTYDIIDVKTGSSNHDLLDIDMKVERISRGSYGVTGFVDIKEDADDRVIVEGLLFRSSNGANIEEYKKMPMQIANETLTFTMNKFYKQYVMDSLSKCSPDAPVFEEFVVPLEKRNIRINKCVISTESLPSHMSDGYYRLLFKIYGPLEAFVDFYFKIESVLF